MSTTQREAPASGSEAPAGGVVEQAQEKVGAGVEQAKSNAGSLVRSQVDERQRVVVNLPFVGRFGI